MKPYINHKPKREKLSPIIITSPHSGSKFTQEFLELTSYNYNAYNSLEDKYVDELYSDAINFGITKIDALYSRSVIDLNRHIDDIDPSMIYDIPDKEFNSNAYIKSGIGLIPKVDQFQNKLYKDKIPWQNALDRINFIYKSWHQNLKKQITNLKSEFDSLVILDCHSMPSVKAYDKKYDFILGNKFGKSCHQDLIDFIRNELSYLGYSVGCNYLYSGGFITSNYNDRYRNINTLQIEVDRDLYMDSETYKKNIGFNDLKFHLNQLLQKLSHFNIDKKIKNIAAE